MWLRQRWGRDYDTGLAAGQWHAMRLDGTGELISAATPDELDVMIEEDAETRDPCDPAEDTRDAAP